MGRGPRWVARAGPHREEDEFPPVAPHFTAPGGVSVCVYICCICIEIRQVALSTRGSDKWRSGPLTLSPPPTPRPAGPLEHFLSPRRGRHDSAALPPGPAHTRETSSRPVPPDAVTLVDRVRC